jgi:O-methyltransferase involved in polyketide biosynthesis
VVIIGGFDAPRTNTTLGEQRDWRRTSITARNRRAFSVAMRTAHFYNWARQFLAVHPEAAVLRLGCGLDTRILRLKLGTGEQRLDE